MVCAKCAQRMPATLLATPHVTRKSDLYHGNALSPSSTSTPTRSRSAYGVTPTTSKTPTGITKSKLLTSSSTNRKNPYATTTGPAGAGGGACVSCKGRTEAGGNKLCQRCAFKEARCAVCGRGMTGTGTGGAGAAAARSGAGAGGGLGLMGRVGTAEGGGVKGVGPAPSAAAGVRRGAPGGVVTGQRFSAK